MADVLNEIERIEALTLGIPNLVLIDRSHKAKLLIWCGFYVVETAGFEPATPCVQIWYTVCCPVLSCAVECRPVRVSALSFVVLYRPVSPRSVPSGSNPGPGRLLSVGNRPCPNSWAAVPLGPTEPNPDG